MPFVDLVCLANSHKMGGRCIAGIRADGTGWVRPVAGDTDYGQLLLRHIRLPDGTDPRVLDIISVDLERPAPTPGQPENWIIGEGKWILKRRPARNPENILTPALTAGPILLGSHSSRIVASAAAPLARSLALVGPQHLKWFLKPDPSDRPQPRVQFELNGQLYDFPVTDPAGRRGSFAFCQSKNLADTHRK